MKLVVSVSCDLDDEAQVFTFDTSSLLTSNAVRREAEASYVISVLHGFRDIARHLAGLSAEGTARDLRANERRG